MRGVVNLCCSLCAERSRRAFYKDFVKVVEAADVILEVIDARDPLAYRCTEVEQFVRSADPNKKIVLLLNKVGDSSQPAQLLLSRTTCCQGYLLLSNLRMVVFCSNKLD